MSETENFRTDAYTRTNRLALYVLDEDGYRYFNGVNRRTIRALARRGLVTDEGDGRAIVTDKGRAALSELFPEEYA